MTTVIKEGAYHWTGKIFLSKLSAATQYRARVSAHNDLGWSEPTHHWNKPLNPILGETYQARSPDGSRYYLEQVSHRPPVAYFVHYGPQDIFRFSSYA